MLRNLSVDFAIDIVTRHPLATIALAAAAGVLSWLMTQREPV
jgi:hypothetical protein